MRSSLRSYLLALTLLGATAADAGWDPGGSPVCTAPGFQGELLAIPVPTTLGFNDTRLLFALWSDSRDTLSAGSNLFFDAISLFGPEGPPVDGSPAVVAPGFQGYADASFTGRMRTQHQPSNGGVVTAWADNRNGALDVYAKRLLDSPFNTPWPADGVPVCTAAGAQNSIRIVGDIDAGATVAWLDPRNGFNAIYAQRLDLDGVPQWAANGIPVCDVPGYRYLHRLAAAPDGGAYFAWVDDQAGPLRAFATRLLPDGTHAPGWPAGGLQVSGLPAFELGALVPDGAGGIFVTFFSNGRPFACRIDDDAQVHPGWPADGIALAQTPFEGGLQDAVACDDGLAVAWVVDIDPGGKTMEFDLVVQRIRADGSRPPGWSAEGNLLCDAPGNQGGARLVATPAVVGVWEDERPGSTGQDVYAMRLLEDGTPDPMWTANGVVIASGNGRQFSPRPVWDGLFGILIVYVDDHDFNSLEPDIYAQRVNSTGTVANTAVPLPGAAGFRLSAPFPNPARSSVTLDLAPAAGAGFRAEVIDALGRRVRTLGAPTGGSTLHWNLRDDAGRRVEPGVYFVRAREDGWDESRAVIVRR